VKEFWGGGVQNTKEKNHTPQKKKKKKKKKNKKEKKGSMRVLLATVLKTLRGKADGRKKVRVISSAGNMLTIAASVQRGRK